jgi:hypothetical protein
MRREATSHPTASLLSGLAAIFVESIALFSIIGLVVSIIGFIDSQLALSILYIWYALGVSIVTSISWQLYKLKLRARVYFYYSQLLSPQLIILRVALGLAWTRKTVIVFSETGIEFTHREPVPAPVVAADNV